MARALRIILVARTDPERIVGRRVIGAIRLGAKRALTHRSIAGEANHGCANENVSSYTNAVIPPTRRPLALQRRETELSKRAGAAVTDRPAGGSTGQRDNAGHAGRGEVRDAERDEIRDAERDAARDAQRDEARDAERDAERDETRDEQRDAARDMTDCGTPRMNDRWRCLRRE
jgi:hypothetical protein